MSWQQDYSVPSVESLLEKLLGKTSFELLAAEMERRGTKISKLEDVILEDGIYETIHGTRVRLADGRVYIPKLTQKLEENGNHGLNVYEFFLEEETPTVQHIGTDTSDPDIDVYTIDDEDNPPTGGCGQYGCGCIFQ